MPSERGALREALARAVLTKRAKENEAVASETMGSKALREVLAKAVLAKAAGDDTFFTRLSQEPDELLRGYDLTSEERAALTSGDIQWLESRVGTLRDPLGTWVTLRLATNKEERLALNQ